MWESGQPEKPLAQKRFAESSNIQRLCDQTDIKHEMDIHNESFPRVCFCENFDALRVPPHGTHKAGQRSANYLLNGREGMHTRSKIHKYERKTAVFKGKDHGEGKRPPHTMRKHKNSLQRRSWTWSHHVSPGRIIPSVERHASTDLLRSKATGTSRSRWLISCRLWSCWQKTSTLCSRICGAVKICSTTRSAAPPESPSSLQHSVAGRTATQPQRFPP